MDALKAPLILTVEILSSHGGINFECFMSADKFLLRLFAFKPCEGH
jgi:hypothetical protein